MVFVAFPESVKSHLAYQFVKSGRPYISRFGVIARTAVNARVGQLEIPLLVPMDSAMMFFNEAGT
jgi:hypothetical protein